MFEKEALIDPTNEVLDFLLSRPTPAQVINHQASAAAQLRLRYLFDKNRENMLNDAERAELESYGRAEHFMRQLKIRAYEAQARNDSA
jgi:hypothetical protein